MATFLAQGWLDLMCKAAEDLPAVPGVSATVDHVVNGAPDGNVAYSTRFEDGRVAHATLGRSADPDLIFTLSYDGAQRVARGELELGAAFMQGTLKVEGDMAKLLPLLESMHHTEYREMVGRLADQTEFG